MGSPLRGKVIESEVEPLFSQFIQLSVSTEDLNCYPNSVDVEQIDNTVTCNNSSDICSKDKSDFHIPLSGNY